VVLYSFIEALEGFPIFFQGQYSDFDYEWYGKVMVTIMGTALINAFSFPMGRLLGGFAKQLLRNCLKKKAKTQHALNSLYKRMPFTLSERYGQMLSVVFYTIVFSAGAPPLVIFAAVYMLLQYVCDKWTLARYSRKPPMYDEKLSQIFLKAAPYAAWAHLAVATWMMGHSGIPSYLVETDYTSVAELREERDSEPDGQFDVNARLTRVNAIVPFVFFVILTVALVIEANLEVLITLFSSVCGRCCVDPEIQGEPDFGDVVGGRVPGKSLSGLLSYRIEDNPDYADLFPEAREYTKVKGCDGVAAFA